MELIIFESPGEEWDHFATRYTDLIFYQSIWSEVLRKGLGGQPLYFCLKDRNEMVAGLPGILLTFKIFKILYASIPYGHLIGEKGYYQPFMELLNRWFQKRGIDQVRMTGSPFLEPYHPNSFKTITTKCTLLDLKGMDKERIWGGYKKNIRRDIRKAQRNGVTVRFGTSREDVKLFYQLYLAAMVRNRAMAKYPFQWFEAVYEEMGKRQLTLFLFAELNQVAIAGVVLLRSPTSTHYFHNGSQFDFLKFCPNELLIHFSLERAIEQGSHCFDFMGSDSIDLSLIKFKEKWGGNSVDTHTHVKDYHPLRCKIWEWGKGLGNSSLGNRLLQFIRH